MPQPPIMTLKQSLLLAELQNRKSAQTRNAIMQSYKYSHNPEYKSDSPETVPTMSP